MKIIIDVNGDVSIDDQDALIKEMIELAEERERICSQPPFCPNCQSQNVQLLSTIKQEWRCRECGQDIMTII